MKIKVKNELAIVNYKGHTIRKIECVFGYEHVFVDMMRDEFENAPALKSVDEWEYASIADAKRMISGKMPKYVPMDLVEYLGINKYCNRFKK